ncbi:MAG: hypothetical protein ACQ9ET_04085 [Nitrosomonadaceae bacterium]
MSSFDISDNERVVAIKEIGLTQPFKYHVHQDYLQGMVGITNPNQFETFIGGLILGGRYSLNDSVLGPVDMISLQDDNDLHLHRHKKGAKIGKKDRETIPSVHVLNQSEVYYSIGLHRLENNICSLPDQLNLCRHVTGQYQGRSVHNVTRRVNQWFDCIVNEEDNTYWFQELPDIIDTFHVQLDIQDYVAGMNDDESVKVQARKRIREILQYTQVLPANEDICIIPQRRSLRHTSGRDRAEQSPPAAASSLLTESLKKVKRRTRKKMNDEAASNLSDRFEDTTAASTDPKAQKKEEMMRYLEFNYLRDKWLSGDEEDKVEVGRLEFLFLGTLAGDSRDVTNAKIRQYEALPFSIPEYDALNNIDVGAQTKTKKRELSRKKQSFERLRNEIQPYSNLISSELNTFYDCLFVHFVYSICSNNDILAIPEYLFEKM